MDYNTMTLSDLKTLAKERGLKKTSTLKKGELILRLEESEHTSRPVSEKEEQLRGKPVEKDAEEKAGEKSTERAVEKADERSTERTAEKAAERPKENGMKAELASLDSGARADGILEVMPDGFGFIRCENYLPGENDVYVSPSQIRRFNLKTGDILVGKIRVKTQNEKYSALLFVESVNGYNPYDAQKRKNFEDLTPVFPNERIRLENPSAPVSMRMVDLLSPIGKGQRGMIVSQPKTGKTTLLKQIARSITTSYPDMKLIVLLIDERPEEVTDIREYIAVSYTHLTLPTNDSV